MKIAKECVIILSFILCFQGFAASDVNESPERKTDYWGISADMMCGPNCLWQIAKVFGKDYSLGTIANMAGMNIEKGTTLAGMVEAAERMGFEARAVKADIGTLKEVNGITVLLLKLGEVGHYVILDKFEADSVRLISGDKFLTLTPAQLDSVWEGYAVVIGRAKSKAASRAGENMGLYIKLTGVTIMLLGFAYGVRQVVK